MSEDFEILNITEKQSKLNLFGKAFYGQKLKSKKDGSYVATLWLSVGYFPIIPYDTYRVKNPEENILPKVYRLDEYIFFPCMKMKFDWMQVLSTLIITWGSFLALFYSTIYIGYEFGGIYGWGMFGLIILGSIFIFWLNYLLYLRPKHEAVKSVEVETSQVESSAKVEQPKSTQPQPIIEVPQVKVIEEQKTQEIHEKPQDKEVKEVPEQREVKQIEKAQEKVEEKVQGKIDKKIKEKIQEEPKFVPEPDRAPSPVPVPVPYAAAMQMASVSKGVSTASTQIKFDPNKILEWHPDTLDKLNYYEGEGIGLVGWLGCFIIILLVAQYLGELFLQLTVAGSTELTEFRSIINILREYKILAIAGVVMFVFTIRELSLIALILLILSVPLFFELQQVLFDFIVR